MMKHLGDITKIKGSEVPIVDIVTGGSPCQDLSIAGKRQGLAGERSGLFMEQIRIIKEMREYELSKRLQSEGANVDIRDLRPRYMVWENVPGAFSSNKGEDFRAVLEETAKVADKNAIIPKPENGKWTPAGCIVADGWSIAWRLHDAQFWGVPQRRKRIALVADFNGQSAPEILFERKSVSGDIEKSEAEKQGITTDAERCIDSASRGGVYDIRISSDGTKNWRAHCYETDISRALDTGGENPDSNHGGVAVVEKSILLQGNGIDRSDNAGCNGKGVKEDISYTLNTADKHAVCYSQDAYDKYSENDKSATLTQSGGMYGGGSETLTVQ